MILSWFSEPGNQVITPPPTSAPSFNGADVSGGRRELGCTYKFMEKSLSELTEVQK